MDYYLARTLLSSTSDAATLTTVVSSTIEQLVASSLIVNEGERTYKATQLGQAIVAASLAPEDGLFVHAEIQRALRAFVMDGEMHIFYMFTPIQSSSLGDINWRIFRDEVNSLDESGIRVMTYVGVNPGLVNRM